MMAAQDTTSPYAESFAAYWDAGWRGILPLPFKRKTFPPSGYTGHGGEWPSYADCYGWSEDGQRNIALRLGKGMVGIDVDHYGSKRGGDTLAGLVSKYGPLPPTWMSTSRRDGISGIRVFRIPEGTTLPSKLPSIEFIQYHHRYIVAAPSVHPDHDGHYQWISEVDGTVTTNPPNTNELPDLPQSWIDGLAIEAANYEKANLSDGQTRSVVLEMRGGEPCEHIAAAVGRVLSATDRHDTYNEAVLSVAGAGRRGCPGAPMALARLRDMFIAEVTRPGTTSRRSDREAEAEFGRSLNGALSIVATEEQGSACPDDVFEWVDQQRAKAESGDIPPQREQPEADGSDDSPNDPPPPGPEQAQYERMLRQRVGEMRMREQAKDILANEKAGAVRPMPVVDLRTFLDQPDDPVKYRVERLWPREGRVLLSAAAKAGKTTMVSGNLVPALVDGGTFLNTFEVEPVAGRVAVFNMEVGESTMRAWMRKAGIVNADRVLVVNLRGQASSLNLGAPAGRARVAALLKTHNVEVAILDPLAPLLASLDLDENANADVAKFFSWWSEMLSMAGVSDDLIVHHTGHDGNRSRGASRLLDEPDAIWNLSRDDEGSDDETDVFGPAQPRYFSAYGRDVEEAEAGLSFDPDTRQLSLTAGNRRQQRAAAKLGDALTRVAEFVGANPGSTGRDVREGVFGRTADIKDALEHLVSNGDVVRVMGKRYGAHSVANHYLPGDVPEAAK